MAPSVPNSATMTPDVPLSTKIRRGVTIAALASALIAGGLWLGMAGPHGLGASKAMRGAERVDSRTVRVGGHDSTVKTIRSPKPPQVFAKEFVNELRRAGIRPQVQPMLDGQCVVSYRDRAGQHVTAVLSATSGRGTQAILVYGEPAQWSMDSDRDAPGADVKDVPRPPDSRRVLAMENPKGSGQFMILYHGFNAASATREFYLRRMPQLGWTFDEVMSRAMSQAQVDSDVVLAEDIMAFKKANRMCIISMSDRPSGEVATTLLVR